MSTNVMIACAGSQRKWNNHLGVPSHLVRDKFGERILDRTIRLIREFGSEHEEITVFAPNDPRYVTSEATVLCPGVAPTEFHTTRELWSNTDRNVLLLGDVWFTGEAINRVLAFPGHSVTFFGRAEKSRVTGSPWGELFGYSWGPEANWIIDDALPRIGRMHARGTLCRFTGWEILYWLQGATEHDVTRNKLFPHKPHQDFFVEINDLTDDIDFPQDYNRHPMFKGKT